MNKRVNGILFVVGTGTVVWTELWWPLVNGQPYVKVTGTLRSEWLSTSSFIAVCSFVIIHAFIYDLHLLKCRWTDQLLCSLDRMHNDFERDLTMWGNGLRSDRKCGLERERERTSHGLFCFGWTSDAGSWIVGSHFWSHLGNSLLCLFFLREICPISWLRSVEFDDSQCIYISHGTPERAVYWHWILQCKPNRMMRRNETFTILPKSPTEPTALCEVFYFINTGL